MIIPGSGEHDFFLCLATYDKVLPMNVLVTGIDGFVGSHLADALLTQSHLRLFGTIRNRPPVIDKKDSSSITRLQADITDIEEVKSVIFEVKPQKIFHIAGQAFVPTAIEHPRDTFRVNIDGVLNILEAVRQLRSKQQISCSVLIISSGQVYGVVPVDRLPIDESFPLNPTNPYAVSKVCADLIAQQYRATFGVDAVVARPFNHIGPRQNESFVGSSFAKQIAEIKLGRREPKLFVGNLEPLRDFTDVRDVVRAYMLLLEKPQRYAVYNVCSEQGIAIREILNLLCELSGVDVTIVPDQSRTRLNDIAKIVGASERLRTSTGWKPNIPLRQTLNDLLIYWEDRLRQSA